MSTPGDLITPQKLSGRIWRPGCVSAARGRRWLRVGFALIVVVVLVGVFVYRHYTDPARVRAMAQDLLSRITRGDVTVGAAEASIFEGLTLRNVEVRAPKEQGGDLLLRAALVQVEYLPHMLLAGRLEASRIIAVEPEVYLTEHPQEGDWNFQRLGRRPTVVAPTPEQQRAAADRRQPVILPEIVIRGGALKRGEVIDGALAPLTSIRIDGRLAPSSPGQYSFRLQSQSGDATPATAPSSQEGLTIDGSLSLGEGTGASTLRGLQLAQVEQLLPARERAFWRQQRISGRVDVPAMQFDRGPDGRERYRIEVTLEDGRMSLQPLQFTDRAEYELVKRRGEVEAELRRQPLVGPAVWQALRRKSTLPEVVPLAVQRGRFIFTSESIEMPELRVRVDELPLVLSAKLTGNMRQSIADAAIELRVTTPDGAPAKLPPQLSFIDAMPGEVREVYYRFRPTGFVNVNVGLTRAGERGARPVINGDVRFDRTKFVFANWPYPIDGASGRLAFERDAALNETRLRIDGIVGRGVAATANESARIRVDGTIQPLEGGSGVDVVVRGENVTIDDPFRESMPADIRESVGVFRGIGGAAFAQVTGDFECRVHRDRGWLSRWSYDTDVTIHRGSGAVREFPMPLQEVRAELGIRSDRVEVKQFEARVGTLGKVIAGGTVRWGLVNGPGQPRGVRTDLTLNVSSLAIDDELLVALPDEAQDQIKLLGISGALDGNGVVHVAQDSGSPARTDYRFDLKLASAALRPPAWKTGVDRLSANLTITPREIAIANATGKRGETDVSGAGVITLAAGTPAVKGSVTARRLVLDAPLRDSLPTPAQSAWDAVAPQGVLDATFAWDGSIRATDVWTVDLSPVRASVTPTFFPIRFDNVTGSASIRNGAVELREMAAIIEGAVPVTLKGNGTFADSGKQSWEVAITAKDVTPSESLMKAMPSGLSTLLTDAKFAGTTDLNLRRLAWTSWPEETTTIAANQPVTTSPTRVMRSSLEFDAGLTLRDAASEFGVGIDRANGKLEISGKVVDGEAIDLSGAAVLDAFRLAGIEAKQGQARLTTDQDGKRIRFQDVVAQIANGDLSGAVEIDRSNLESTRWGAEFKLRGAELGKVVGDAPAAVAAGLSGTMNASVAIAGAWPAQGDSAALAKASTQSRRGRGDISVSGEKMVRVPLVVGATQLVNLQLPFTTGFNDANASYVIDGPKLTFTDLTLKSREMQIRGGGWVDFDSREVSLNFTTDTQGKPLPVIGDLLNAARRELLQIRVRGTLSEPEVKAGSLRTITATVDRILDDGNDSGKK